MKKLTSEMKAEIYGLAWLTRKDLFRKYQDLLSDMPKCRTLWLLRAIVAYRLQEKAFGMKLSKEMKKYLEVIGGDPAMPVKDRRVLKTGTRIIRNWKGKDYVVYVREDGVVEYNDVMFNSLTACARTITGTRCNGRVFFGIEPRKRRENGPAES